MCIPFMFLRDGQQKGGILAVWADGFSITWRDEDDLKPSVQELSIGKSRDTRISL